ncbi:galactose-binding domain-like protein [Rhodofomes roseus]|uniref:Galactose-binding domain-like protein n=1 Tax=Rhodofomes roseus TaxID=34475 RepID=A0ABQ8KME1_9APHY|nr:galactose-binding domain-like protein [Rhodofomes roseus]KAH9838796.1 galactose-binding domain-like protein [Rhodofomes roseus]
MPHTHDHGNCNDEHHDHHHDIPEGTGPRDNLYSHIDRDNVIVLNAQAPANGPEVIKPWDQRLDEEKYIESDADDQIIIRVPFTGAVKLRAILVKSGPGDQTPAKMSIFNNLEHVDFSNITDMKSVQEFDVAQGRDIGEYHVMPAKFSSVTSVTLFFPESQGADTTRIYYVGFLGTFSGERKGQPIITVYESRPNIADHPKITEALPNMQG